MTTIKAWWNWLYDQLGHSYAWALIMAMNSAWAIATLDEVSEWWYYLLRLFSAALYAKWAHSTWHRAELRRVARQLERLTRS